MSPSNAKLSSAKRSSGNKQSSSTTTPTKKITTSNEQTTSAKESNLYSRRVISAYKKNKANLDASSNLILSDAFVTQVLKNHSLPQLMFPPAHPPRLSVLFTNDELNRLLKDKSELKDRTDILISAFCSRAKRSLSILGLKVSRLPNDFFLQTRSMISVSVSKHNFSAPSVKPKDAKASPVPPSSTQDVLDFLKNCVSPRFTFNEQPDFATLFPGTTKPAYTLKSGNPYVDPTAFNPLIASRLSSARKALSKNKITTSHLPASFVRNQQQLILQSLVIVKRNKKKAAKAKAKAAKLSSKAQGPARPALEFVQDSQVPPASEFPQDESVDASERPVPGSSSWFMKYAVIFDTVHALLACGVSPTPKMQTAFKKVAPELLQVFPELANSYSHMLTAPFPALKASTYTANVNLWSSLHNLISAMRNMSLETSLSELNQTL